MHQSAAVASPADERRALTRDEKAQAAIDFINRWLRGLPIIMVQYFVWLRDTDDKPNELVEYLLDDIVFDMVKNAYQVHGWEEITFYSKHPGVMFRRSNSGPVSLPSA